MAWIGKIVIVLFAVVGLAFLCRKAADCLLRPRKGRELLLVLPFRGRVEDAEHQLRHYAAQYEKLAGGVDSGWLICLDAGMDEETHQICERVSGEFPFCNVCTREQLEKLI